MQVPRPAILRMSLWERALRPRKSLVKPSFPAPPLLWWVVAVVVVDFDGRVWWRLLPFFLEFSIPPKASSKEEESNPVAEDREVIMS